jgi:hypothetical protein
MNTSYNTIGGRTLMDRISQSLLDEFTNENGIKNLDESQQFEHFASYLTVRRFYNDQFNTADIVTGAGNDTSIDGFAVLINGALVVDLDELAEFDKGGYLDVTFLFIQAERSSNFDGAKIGTFGEGVMDFFRPEPLLRRNENIKKAVALMSAIYDRGSEFKKNNPICRLDYVTTGSWQDDPDLSARMRIVRENLEKTNLFSKVEFIPTGAVQLQTLYRQTKNAIEKEFTFEKKQALPELPNVQESYIGYLPATEFLKLIKNDEGELIQVLFNENPRDWLDYNQVNTEIQETLQSDKRTRFVLMNNGVTIIANSLRPQGNKFNIGGYSIVNGCQTSHVLFDAQDALDEVLIPVRLIATQDEDVINDIITATNRQTEVKDEQFYALYKFSKLLEEYFGTFPDAQKLYYERRTFQYARLQIEKARIVTAPSLIRAFAAMFGTEPHRTTRNYKTIKDKVGKQIFGEGHRLEPYYTAAFALYKIEFAFRNGRLDTKYKNARYHLLLAMRWLANADPIPRMNENKMKAYCEKILNILWDNDKADALITAAAEIIEKSADGDFSSNNIRTEPFTRRVLRELGVEREGLNETETIEQS